ncbi:hypothetical protein OQA88_13190 [Cercophora sp. LCS_1]
MIPHVDLSGNGVTGKTASAVGKPFTSTCPRTMPALSFPTSPSKSAPRITSFQAATSIPKSGIASTRISTLGGARFPAPIFTFGERRRRG